MKAWQRRHDRRAERATRRQRRALKRLYGQFISPGDLCFDIGANVGERTRIFLALGARTIALEPQPDCAAKLLTVGSADNLCVLEKAAGRSVGTAFISRPIGADTVASMNPEWIDRVRRSGRFEFDWNQSVEVEVTTLDALVHEHGVPSFCKIDVEGYEEEVLGGLSQPLPVLSFEFTPEYLDSTERCLRLLRDLGYETFSYSLGETGRLEGRMGHAELLERLGHYRSDTLVFGDVYAIFSQEKRPVV